MQAPIQWTMAVAPVLVGVQFLVPNDWVITDVEVDVPASYAITCNVGGSNAPRRVVTCGGTAPDPGEQDYTVTVAPASDSVTPAPGGQLTYTYTDVNTLSMTKTVPITTTS